MLANSLRIVNCDVKDDDFLPEIARQRAARYRWTADYIADPSLSPYLLRVADEYERLALTDFSAQQAA
jgi:hypothetical protein